MNKLNYSLPSGWNIFGWMRRTVDATPIVITRASGKWSVKIVQIDEITENYSTNQLKDALVLADQLAQERGGWFGSKGG